MTTFVWNILLAVIWAIALGPMTPFNLVVGFVVGYLMLALAWRLGLGDQNQRINYFRRVFQVLSFLVFFSKEMVAANIKMAYYTVQPLSRLRPGIVSVPIDGMSDIEITTLANLITLTPGTLSLDISEDNTRLIVHCMDASDPEAVEREIREGFQRRVKELMR